MTKAEAIERLTLVKNRSHNEDYIKALQMAIEALERETEIENEINKLQQKYDENGYELPSVIKLQRIDQHIEAVIKTLEGKQEARIVPLIGDKVKVIKNKYNHYFKIGDIVEVTNYDPSDKKFPYLCCNDSDVCWLSIEEFEIVGNDKS